MQDTDLIRLDFVISESWSRQLKFATPSKKSFSSRFGGSFLKFCDRMAAKVAWNPKICKTMGVKVNSIIDEVLELSQFKFSVYR